MSVNSENIKIFPCVSRDTSTEDDIKSRLMSEENITNLIKSVTDNKSYVIDVVGDTTDKTFLFVLDGYYIELDIQVANKPIYVYMNDESKLSSGSHLLIKGDNGGVFEGISVTSEKPSDSICLQLWDGASVPQDSFKKFELKSSAISYDFGELK